MIVVSLQILYIVLVMGYRIFVALWLRRTIIELGGENKIYEYDYLGEGLNNHNLGTVCMSIHVKINPL